MYVTCNVVGPGRTYNEIYSSERKAWVPLLPIRTHFKDLINISNHHKFLAYFFLWPQTIEC